MVLLDDFDWYNVDGESHVFVTLHRHVEIQILEIDAHELGVRHGYNTVEEDLGCSKIDCFSAYISGLVYKIASNG